MRVTSTAVEPAESTRPSLQPRPLLTVVVPVYNGGDEVVENVGVIQRTVSERLAGEDVELVVVSDGSIDGTAERLLEAREAGIRVIHYDRNLGKGYAVKAGALAAHGNWVALVDADLDLDPGSIPSYLELARREQLDFVIGSKRHPDSVVRYPPLRRAASWCYQQLNRALFRLDVRDTQVGLKVFSRRVVEEVMPLLLVKRFAFDLELLAVAAALGHRRIRELPVRLEYRFSGSELGSREVARALWDTAAIFYRLRILRTYQRKRHLLRAAASVPPEAQPLVSVVGDADTAAALDYERLEVVDEASAGRGELLAIVARGARPAGNWVTAAVPFFANPGVAAVVTPTVAPLRGTWRERVAAAVLESRLGGGSRRLLYLPGNVRVVSDHAAESAVVRRADYVAALQAGVEDERLIAWLAERGRRTIYTPDASVSAAPPPLFLPHIRGTIHHARARGAAARRTRGASLSRATSLSFLPPGAAILGASFLLAGGGVGTAGLALVLAYAGALAFSGVHAATRFRSLAVGALQPPMVLASQAAYLYGFVRGLVERSG